jgi:hypothetical protein
MGNEELTLGYIEKYNTYVTKIMEICDPMEEDHKNIDPFKSIYTAGFLYWIKCKGMED